MRPPRSNLGVTLIELCVALAILSILTFYAFSLTPALLQHQRSDSAIKDVFRLFRLAKTQAITSGSIVTLCPLDSSGRCSNDWSQPVSIFLDPDNSRSLSGAETLIKQIPAPSLGQFQAAPANRRYFQFGSLGGAKGTLGNLTYCPENDSDMRYVKRLIISFAGRIRLARDQNGDGQVDNADGSPITCR